MQFFSYLPANALILVAKLIHLQPDSLSLRNYQISIIIIIKTSNVLREKKLLMLRKLNNNDKNKWSEAAYE